MPLILEDAENNLTPLSREMFAEHYERLAVLDDEIKTQDQRIKRLCQANDTVHDLQKYEVLELW